MGESMSIDAIKYIIARLVKNAFEAKEESQNDKNNEFEAGRQVAYYEMLDILKTELLVREVDLREFGLDINLEKTFL